MAVITAELKAGKGDFAASKNAASQDPSTELLSLYDISIKSSISRDLNRIDVGQARRADQTPDSYFKRLSGAPYFKVIERITWIKLIELNFGV